jgi:hypothetical protein
MSSFYREGFLFPFFVSFQFAVTKYLPLRSEAAIQSCAVEPANLERLRRHGRTEAIANGCCFMRDAGVIRAIGSYLRRNAFLSVYSVPKNFLARIPLRSLSFAGHVFTDFADFEKMH